MWNSGRARPRILHSFKRASPSRQKTPPEVATRSLRTGSLKMKRFVPPGERQGIMEDDLLESKDLSRPRCPTFRLKVGRRSPRQGKIEHAAERRNLLEVQTPQHMLDGFFFASPR